MKLANRVYIATLLILMLAFAATAQNQENHRSAKDPRNTAPTVGTGGPIGGPTGLFTVYDGSTLRKGEYTFSVAYSNYDRDPGNVDITSMPASFQIGVTNNLEFFFNSELYRAVKVNSPRHLSSFYLPNSAFGYPAIVLAPQGLGNSQYPNAAVYRPAGAPWAAYPYTGANAGTYGLLPPFYSGPIFGFPAGTNALLGPPRPGGGGGADLFPGVGSIYGSILPGVVLQSMTLTNAAGAPAGEAPRTFTLAPTYLPDAPFINRAWSSSSVNTMDFGVKWRLTDNSNPIGFGFIAAYTWNMDKADTVGGFNQLQRGSGGGGNLGDVTGTLFADARVAKWANVSANIGYKWTSDTKSNLGGGTVTLLDRPDELHSSIGFDFPVNQYFQPIAEFRSLYYVGGRTPNAFENNPMDLIVGARIFARRWIGLSLAYRYNLNQQDTSSFSDSQTFTAGVVQGCSTVSTNCTPSVINTTFTGIPRGFNPSIDPHGFIVQMFVGRRNTRLEDIPNQPAVVNSVTLSDSVITLGCPPGTKSKSGGCNDNRTISVSTSASDPENDVLTYNYTVSGGRIVGTGANVQWDMTGVGEGTYTITTGVDDGCGVCGKTDTKTVKVEACPDCEPVCNCPTLSVSGPGGITNPGDTMTFTANVSNPSGLSYTWNVSSGTIEAGQGSRSITVRTTREMSGSNVTATVDISGLDANCNCIKTASETAGVAPLPEAVLIDEFGKAVDDDVKARVDTYYIQLNNNPTAQGYIINYGSAADIKKRRAQIMKAINFRGYDVSRVTFVDGPNTGAGAVTKLWLVPAGADNPNP